MSKISILKFLIFGFFLFFGLFPIKHALAAPFLTLSPFSGHAGAISVSGGGFSSGEEVKIFLRDSAGLPAATVKAKANSLFGPVTVNIPGDTTQGNIMVTAVGSTSGTTASNTYYVVPFAPVLDVKSSGNTPGTVITLSGTGFAPGEQVNFFMGGAGGGSTKADGKGNFSKFSFTIPSLTPDTYQIEAKGETSGSTAKNYFYVGTFYPVASPSSYYVMPGQAITFNGYNFVPGEQVSVVMGEGQQPVGTITVSGKGDFKNAGSFTPSVDLAGQILSFHLKSSKSAADIPATVSIGQFNSLVTPSAYYLIPGQTLDFYGKGFAPNETIQIYQGSAADSLSPTNTITADKNGGFTKAGSLVIPYSAANSSLVFKFVGQSSNTSSSLSVSVGAFIPEIHPSEYYLTPGKTFTVWGKGFAAGEKVTVTAGQESVTVATDKFGVFKTAGPFTAPYEPGTKVVVTATGQSSSASISVTLGVGSLHPNIIPDSYYITPGDQVKLSGYGFAPGEDVLLQNGQQETLATIKTDKYGNFTNYSVSTPFSGVKTLGFNFVGAKSGAVGTVSVSIATLHPLVIPDTYYVVPGSTIRVMGTGFSRGEPITITGGTTALTVNATKDGYTPWMPVTLPMDLLAKEITITFTGNATGASNSAVIGLAPFLPQIYPSTYYTAPGSLINLKGTGFAAGEKINILFNKENATSTTADLSGAFSIQGFKIPITSDTAYFNFAGVRSQASASLNIALAPFNPQIYPSTYYAAPGQTVDFSGVGFAPGESVDIAMNSQPVESDAVNDQGRFATKKITIPIDATKAAVFTFTSPISHASATITVALSAFQPQIYPSQYFSSPGTPLSFKGFGFAPGEKISIIYNEQEVATATADAKGNFLSDKINLPMGVTKAHFTFDSSISHYSNPIDVSVGALSPVVTLSSYYEAGGKPLTVYGMGFASKEQVAITFDNNQLGTVTADQYGSFSFKTTVPFVEAGEKQVQATGQTSGVSSSATFGLPQAFTNVQLKAYAGAPGSAVTFVGSGFSPSETVNITTDKTGEAAVYSFKADAKGNFNNSGFVIPANFKGGQLIITLKGEHSLAASKITYYVTGAQ